MKDDNSQNIMFYQEIGDSGSLEHLDAYYEAHNLDKMKDSFDTTEYAEWCRKQGFDSHKNPTNMNKHNLPTELIDILVKFQEWTIKIQQAEPMRLETDYDDVAMMFLEETPKARLALEEKDKEIERLKSPAMPSFMKQIAVDYLKEQSYEDINDMLQLLSNKLKKSNSENKELRERVECLIGYLEIYQRSSVGNPPELPQVIEEAKDSLTKTEPHKCKHYVNADWTGYADCVICGKPYKKTKDH